MTGGYVYRGERSPGLRGIYLYGDFVSGTLWGLRYANGKVTRHEVLVEMPQVKPLRQIASFGEDNRGEIYILAYDGKIYELAEKRGK